jgi:hypothetical protein
MKIVFYISTRNQYFCVSPVIRKCISESNEVLCVIYGGILTGLQIERILKKEKINYRTLEEYSNKEAVRKIRTRRSYILKNYKEKIRKKISVEYRNILDYFILKREKIEESMKLIEWVKNSIKKEGPDIVVFTNLEGDFGRVIAEVSYKNKIPSLYIPHTALISFLPIRESFYKFHITKIAVAGTLSKEFLKEKGIPEEKIVVTGFPAYDILKDYVRK